MTRLFTFLTLFSAVGAHAAEWKLDQPASELVVKVWKTGAAAAFAHDHVIRAAKFTGQVKLDEAGAPESLALDLSVEVASLIPDELDSRKRHGVVGPAVSEGDQAKIRENMLSAEQLDAKQFPTIRFVSSKLSREESGAWTCTGKLTLHGVTKEVVFPVTFEQGEGSLVGKAKLRVKTSDFGVKPFTAALGLIKNKDEVEFDLVVAMKR